MSKLQLWDGNKIVIRPSAVDGFAQCSYQWYHAHVLGQSTIPSARAAIGTAIHAAAENEWTKAIASGKKDFNLSAMHDAAIAEFHELDADGLQYDEGEDSNTAEATILQGVDAYAEDISPFVDIPIAVEVRYTIDIDNPVVKAVSGTIDYLGNGIIADTKTSKRKPVVESYVTQQSIYKLLAEQGVTNEGKPGAPIYRNQIHGVVLAKTGASGTVLDLTPNVPRAKVLVNSMLETLDIMAKDIVPPEVLFRGNPKYYLCDKKYCALYNTCPFVKGAESEPKAIKL
jgi:hypothetical protein